MFQEAKCKVPILKVPERAVFVSIDDKDMVRNWNNVSLKKYKMIGRSWRGYALSESHCIPLLTELGQNEDDNEDSSSVSSDEVNVLYSEPSVKVQYELLVKNSSEKQACCQDVSNVDYSVNDESVSITIKGS